MTKRSNSKISGFTVVETLIILLILAVLGGAGWYVYHKNHKISVSTNVNASTSVAGSSNKPAQVTQQYLDIKEWGIKIPLTSAISDANYVIATDSTGTAWLGLKSLDSICPAERANNPGAGGADLALAALVRVSPTEQEPVQGKPYSQLYPGTVIDGYFIGFVSHPNASKCAPSSRLQSINLAFSNAIKGAISDTANENIVKMPELGIKIVNIPSGLNDLTYQMASKTGTLFEAQADFSTKSLTDKDAGCSFGSVGSLFKAQGTYNSATDTGPFTFVKQFSGFWVAYKGSGVPCSQNSTTVSLQTSQISAFSELVKNTSNIVAL